MARTSREADDETVLQAPRERHGSPVDALLIVGFGLVISWFSRKRGWPASVGQVLLGIVLGEAVLGWVHSTPELALLGQIGVVLLLGVAGLEIGFDHLKAAGWPAVWVAVLGILLSGAGGYWVGRASGFGAVEATFTGVALTATSIGISVQVLEQLGLVSHRVGLIVLAAAVVDDILALFLLAAAHGAVIGDAQPVRIAVIVGLAAPLLAAVYWSTRLVMRTLWPHPPAGRSVYITFTTVVSILTAAALTHILGYSAVVGAFFAALGIGEAMDEDGRMRLATHLQPFVWVLTPFFFVLIGTKARWDVLAAPGMPALLAGLLLVAVAGKVIGGMAGAIRDKFRSRLLVGASMVPRGEVTIIIASVAFTQQHISHHVFSVLVAVAIFTAVIGPMFMTLLARKMVATGT